MDNKIKINELTTAYEVVVVNDSFSRRALFGDTNNVGWVIVDNPYEASVFELYAECEGFNGMYFLSDSRMKGSSLDLVESMIIAEAGEESIDKSKRIEGIFVMRGIAAFDDLLLKDQITLKELYGEKVQLSSILNQLILEESFSNQKGDSGSVNIDLSVSVEGEYTDLKTYSSYVRYNVVREEEGHCEEHLFEYSLTGLIEALKKYNELVRNFTFEKAS